MANEILTYTQPEYPNAAIITALTNNARKAEPAVSPNLRGWLEEAAQLIEKHSLEILGWNRKMGATLAHLKQAYQKLDQAEDKITTLQNRVVLLETLATTDDLTGLKNRRGFREGFDREIETCKRLGLSGLLVMIDMDNFKAINDTYGHLAGDAVLKLVARTLAGEVRKSDIAARVGGDEFVLMLSNTSKEKAVTRAQMISWQLNNLSLAWYGDVISIQASIGLKEFNGEEKIDNIIQSADATLYANKSERRQLAAIQS